MILPMPNETTTVRPAALHPGDVIVRDPDHPDRAVTWEVTRTGAVGSVIIAEYQTPDGTEGRHGFGRDDLVLVARACGPQPGGAAA